VWENLRIESIPKTIGGFEYRNRRGRVQKDSAFIFDGFVKSPSGENQSHGILKLLNPALSGTGFRLPPEWRKNPFSGLYRRTIFEERKKYKCGGASVEKGIEMDFLFADMNTKEPQEEGLQK